MRAALGAAVEAAALGEVPVGAVVVRGDELVAVGYNLSIREVDPTAHAEIVALRRAARRLGNYRLTDVELYVTVEPCIMCVGALVWARVKRLVFGTRDEKAGAVVSKLEAAAPGLWNHSFTVTEGIEAEACRRVLQDFFQARRGG
ncbi:MAG: tRNA adenosine(34) deaminase TadA [Acidobacteriota bacterium]